MSEGLQGSGLDSKVRFLALLLLQDAVKLPVQLLDEVFRTCTRSAKTSTVTLCTLQGYPTQAFFRRLYSPCLKHEQVGERG